ncbi:hypothetical protein ABE957_15245 [Halomonas sp. CS7]|uniref:Polysaccharide (De)acetylase n=1 Tax=Halomonas pelophila TaxID=3151122 RepID=A0ABV1N8H9_9GAMM
MASMARLKTDLMRTATNLRGWRTRRKLVVIESDDWGAIRMPSRHAYENLLKARIRVDRSPYDRLDCLENRQDLEALFNVLDSHCDSQGSPAIFTFNTVMGNPDFAAIKRSGFEKFYHQPFRESYKAYHGDDLWPLWQQAMVKGLIKPQFHAREHLNSTQWMEDLRAEQPETRIAFEHNFYGLKTRTGALHQNKYLTAYWPASAHQFKAILAIMNDGLRQFEMVFGFRSETFVACNYTWPSELEEPLAKNGIRMIQTLRGHPEPQLEGSNGLRSRRHFTGQRNKLGQSYSVRNVQFESYVNKNKDWSGQVLEEIKQAFVLRKPAVICTHRINYVGGMDVAHRDRNLKLLDKLLGDILKRWPDVEFISSDELAITMECE